MMNENFKGVHLQPFNISDHAKSLGMLLQMNKIAVLCGETMKLVEFGTALRQEGYGDTTGYFATIRRSPWCPAHMKGFDDILTKTLLILSGGKAEEYRVCARYNKSAISEDGTQITIVYMDEYNSIGD